jgi:hypothetical protein
MRRNRTTVLILAAALLVSLLPAAPAFAEPQTGFVTVQVTTPSGTPLKVAGIPLLVEGTAIERIGTTDANGRVEFGTFPVGVSAGVTATPPDGSIYIGNIGRAIPTNLSSPKVTVKLPLPVGARIKGTVRKTSGAVFPSAEVRLLTSSGATILSTTTDVSGRYSFVGLTSGYYRVQFNARGAAASSTPATIDNSWSYWKTATTWKGAVAIHALQQRIGHSATISTANGVVPKGHTLTANLTSGAPTNAVVNVVGLNPTNTFDYTVDSAGLGGPKFVVRLNKGSYRLAVIGYDGTTPFWWTGNSTIASSNPSDAKYVTFTGMSNVTITFQLPPA